MIDQPLHSLPTTVTELNKLPLSQHILTLFEQENESPECTLVVVSLLLWATEHQYQDWQKGEMEVGAAIRASQNDPQATYWNLADERMMDATTLAEAAAVMASVMSDLLDDRSLPD